MEEANTLLTWRTIRELKDVLYAMQGLPSKHPDGQSCAALAAVARSSTP